MPETVDSITYPTVSAPKFVDNPAAAAAFEAGHTPHIDLSLLEGVTRISVQTSFYADHPNELGHYFDWIDLFVADQPIAHWEGTGAVTSPYVGLMLNLAPGTEIVALAHCNLHGTWGARATVADDEADVFSHDGIA
ncbi:MAG: class II SORL domain-containing protein [Actinomycetes bacterium]|jgi:desulfoferrodoxin (superoxide reductase-like protein)|nr:class II SORL domain-containing protein [Actinomycetes bacterium]